ncbi:MAG: hypothetical protein GF307_09685, partial [candidate division Zixibacteria bacterium]|nr:hypothetical protein [candidate division Zixibacteria bacterium]
MFRNFYGEFVKEHHTMPLWNPYLYGGMPFIDAMHGDTFFPLAALQFILPIQRALGYKLVIMVFFGGVFMYMFLLRFNFSPTLAMFGGLAYMLSGFLVSLVYAGHDGRMYITALLPLILMATISILRNKSLKSLLFFAFSFSILILANHPQFAYFAMWCVGAYFIYGVVRQFLDKKNINTLLKPSIIIITAIILGLAGSIVQLLPPYIYVNNYSPRAEESRGYDYAASWSMHQEEALSLILPGFVGTSVGDDDNYWGKNAFRLHSDYPGIIVTVLALLAVFYYRRKREIYFFTGVAIFALLYALGDHTPVFKLFYYVVPGVKSFRAPSTIMFLYIFSLVFIAVHGLKLLIDPELSARRYKKYLYFLSACAGILAFIALLFTVAAESIFKLWASIFYSSIPDVKSMSFETMG